MLQASLSSMSSAALLSLAPASEPEFKRILEALTDAFDQPQLASVPFTCHVDRPPSSPGENETPLLDDVRQTIEARIRAAVATQLVVLGDLESRAETLSQVCANYNA